MLHQALCSLADCQDSVSKERDGQVTWWRPPWACGGALQSKEVSGGCSSGEGSRHRVCSPCWGSPTGVVVGQWVALPAVVVGILDPDSRKPSPQIQQVKWGMQVLTKQHSASYLWQSNNETCEDFLSWQDLLTPIWKTGDSYPFIFRFQAAGP